MEDSSHRFVVQHFKGEVDNPYTERYEAPKSAEEQLENYLNQMDFSKEEIVQISHGYTSRKYPNVNVFPVEELGILLITKKLKSHEKTDRKN